MTEPSSAHDANCYPSFSPSECSEPSCTVVFIFNVSWSLIPGSTQKPSWICFEGCLIFCCVGPLQPVSQSLNTLLDASFEPVLEATMRSVLYMYLLSLG